MISDCLLYGAYTTEKMLSENNKLKRKKKKHDLLLRKRIFLFDKYNGKCAYCGKSLQIDDCSKISTFLVIEHIDADHKNNNINNLNPSCHKCNSQKGLKNLEDYRNFLTCKHNNVPYFTREQKEWLKLKCNVDINSYHLNIKRKHKFYFESEDTI